MIVIGADAHKNTHALAAVDAGTGEVRGECEIPADDVGHCQALRWAHALAPPTLSGRCTPIDALPHQPALDHGLARPERLDELRDPGAGASELHYLLAHLDSIAAGHSFLLAERRRIPETRLR